MIRRIIIEGVFQNALQRNRPGGYASPHSPIRFRVRVERRGAEREALQTQTTSRRAFAIRQAGLLLWKGCPHTCEMICPGQNAKSMSESKGGREPAFSCNKTINATERPERGSFDAGSDFSFAVHCRSPFSGKSRHGLSRRILIIKPPIGDPLSIVRLFLQKVLAKPLAVAVQIRAAAVTQTCDCVQPPNGTKGGSPM